jgi:hypothetical protein
MIIDLVNVKVELLPSTSLHDRKTFIEPSCFSLAKIDFIKSKFVFEGFSDWSKTMDLVSQDVLLHDTRNEGNSYILVVVHLLLLKVAKTNLQLGRVGGRVGGWGGCWRSSQVPKSYNGDLESCFS